MSGQYDPEQPWLGLSLSLSAHAQYRDFISCMRHGVDISVSSCASWKGLSLSPECMLSMYTTALSFILPLALSPFTPDGATGSVNVLSTTLFYPLFSDPVGLHAKLGVLPLGCHPSLLDHSPSWSRTILNLMTVALSKGCWMTSQVMSQRYYLITFH